MCTFPKETILVARHIPPRLDASVSGRNQWIRKALSAHVDGVPQRVAFLRDVSLSRRNQTLWCLSAPLGNGVALQKAFQMDVYVSQRN